MDKKYFGEKLTEIYAVIDADFESLESPGKVSDILHQIARDAAKEQRKKCYPACNVKPEVGCNNCTVKMEFPHE